MKYLNKFNPFVENINQIPISNFESYIDGISKSIIDKLFFIGKVKFDCLVDFGCANGKILSEIKKILPNVRLIGYDIDQAMISKAKENEGILFTSNWNEVVAEIKKYKTPIVNLSSVIHEVYSYSHGSLVKKFWEEQIFSDKFKYIIIRDMIPSTEMSKSESFKSDVRKIKLKSNKFYLNSFEKKWGKISDNYKVLTHFLLKYKFTDNWEREVNENYLPISLETLKKKIPNNYSIIYEDSFILPYLRDQVMKDFGIELAHTTHTKMILKNNMRVIKEAKAYGLSHLTRGTFLSSDQFKNLENKYKINNAEIKDYFTDVTDEFNLVNILNQFLSYKITDYSKFYSIISLQFRISHHANDILNIEKYTEILKKQILDIESVENNCKRFSKMEGFDYKIDDIRYSGNETVIEYIFNKTIESDELLNAKNKFLEKVIDITPIYNEVINTLLFTNDKPLQNDWANITQINTAKKLINIHPDYLKMDNILFGFNTNDEIIVIANYDKLDGDLHFNDTELKRALKEFKSGNCSDYLK